VGFAPAVLRKYFRTMVVALAVIAVVFLVLVYRGWGAAVFLFREHLKEIRGICQHLFVLSEGPEESLRVRMLDMEDAVERLPRKWEDIKREALASESRARAHIKRAQKELGDRGLADPGVDQLGRELSLLNGDGSEDETVPAVPESVAEPAAPDIGPEDWRELTRNRKFGG